MNFCLGLTPILKIAHYIMQKFPNPKVNLKPEIVLTVSTLDNGFSSVTYIQSYIHMNTHAHTHAFTHICLTTI